MGPSNIDHPNHHTPSIKPSPRQYHYCHHHRDLSFSFLLDSPPPSHRPHHTPYNLPPNPQNLVSGGHHTFPASRYIPVPRSGSFFSRPAGRAVSTIPPFIPVYTFPNTAPTNHTQPKTTSPSIGVHPPSTPIQPPHPQPQTQEIGLPSIPSLPSLPSGITLSR
ncbi:hypothetical protein EX30DRAFT_225933 [Ascodesmis nigricans]|uniref:Uncharacterized protein n=1 Tax=Ascodesmis nigricans TaxID=341454 RepID=A0A4V3SHM9_9PEZI|nr:hypothetical protein EX30DRAFT_225933 [Ascodesmis nigricans]